MCDIHVMGTPEVEEKKEQKKYLISLINENFDPWHSWTTAL